MYQYLVSAFVRVLMAHNQTFPYMQVHPTNISKLLLIWAQKLNNSRVALTL